LLAGLALLVGVPAGPIPAVLACLAGWTLASCGRRLADERSADRHRTALVAAVSALADEYAAGASTGAAFDRSAVVAGRFRVPLAEAGLLAGYGGEPADALAGVPALAPLAVACALVGRTGASLTQLLAGVRADLAADQASRRAIAAAVAGPRTSAMLLATLPAVGLAMGAGMGADPARVLLHSAVGLAALTAGVLLNLAGLVWTLRLTRVPAA
jgi:tight adherence protein B